MVENNPITTLLSQYYQLYPENSSYQFLLNIGSGSRPEDLPHGLEGSGGILGAMAGAYKASALNRVVSAYDWLLRGLSCWEKYTKSIETTSELRERCIRLDADLKGMAARLDDAEAIPQLKDRVHSDIALLAEIDRMANRIIASMFYFELESVPLQEGTTSRGLGRILCLRKSGDPSLSPLIEKLIAWNARFAVNGKIMGGSLLSPTFWDEKGNFLMPVTFHVATGQKLSVTLQWPDGRSYPISGSSYRIPALIKKQGLHAPFGLPDHRRWHRKPRTVSTNCVVAESKGLKSTYKRKSIGNGLGAGGYKMRKLWWPASQRLF